MRPVNSSFIEAARASAVQRRFKWCWFRKRTTMVHGRRLTHTRTFQVATAHSTTVVAVKDAVADACCEEQSHDTGNTMRLLFQGLTVGCQQTTSRKLARRANAKACCLQTRRGPERWRISTIQTPVRISTHTAAQAGAASLASRFQDEIPRAVLAT